MTDSRSILLLAASTFSCCTPVAQDTASVEAPLTSGASISDGAIPTEAGAHRPPQFDVELLTDQRGFIAGDPEGGVLIAQAYPQNSLDPEVINLNETQHYYHVLRHSRGTQLTATTVLPELELQGVLAPASDVAVVFGGFMGTWAPPGASLDSTVNPVAAYGGASTATRIRGRGYPSLDGVVARVADGAVSWSVPFNGYGDQLISHGALLGNGDLLFAGSFLAEMTVQGTTLRDPLGSLTARAFVAKLSADGVLRQIDALALAPPVAFSANAAGAAVLVSKQPLPDDENGAEEYVVALLDESRAATEFSLTWPERAGTLNDVAIDDQRNVYICVSGWDSSAETAFGVLKQGEVALARFTPNGETVWLRQFSSLSYSTTFARRGSVLGMVGTFNAPLDLGSGLLTPNGEYSAFFAEFDLDGQSLYSTAFTNTEQTGFGKLHALADGWGAEFYTAGSGLTLGSPATAIPAGNYTMLIREVK